MISLLRTVLANKFWVNIQRGRKLLTNLELSRQIKAEERRPNIAGRKDPVEPFGKVSKGEPRGLIDKLPVYYIPILMLLSIPFLIILGVCNKIFFGGKSNGH